MINLDTNAGMARDVGEIWRNEESAGATVVVHIDLADDNEIVFAWDERKMHTCLYMPIERIRALLVADMSAKKESA